MLITNSRVYAKAVVKRSLDEALAQARCSSPTVRAGSSAIHSGPGYVTSYRGCVKARELFTRRYRG